MTVLMSSESAPSIIGPYQILEEVGRGGMGVVYRARDSRLQRDVALKLLHGATAADPARLRRFLKEGRAAAALDHPNILAVHDIAIDSDPPYVVSELVDGGSLRTELNRRPIPIPRLLDIAIQIADALAAAHRANLVHRDLKPQNVMITRAGRVKIVDFGLAKELPVDQGGSESETLTTAQMIVGTPSYMSPEQARGAAVDFRADVFSFGVVLYEMATARRAFERPSTIETLSAILHEEPPPIGELNRNVPVEVQRIVRRCMAKLPDDRYAATLDLLHDLRAAANATAETGPERPRQRGARTRLATAGLLSAVLAATFFAGWSVPRSAPVGGTGVAEPPSWRRLTFRQGYVHAARFTSDAQNILYSAAWDGGRVATFSLNTQGPESRPLDLPPAGLLSVSRSGQLALSLGCQYIFANGGCAGTLAQVPASGGAPRPLTDEVRSADWGPDESLATATLVGEAVRVEYPAGTVLSNRGGGHVRVSADGRRVAWTETDSTTGVQSGTLNIVVRDERGTRTLSQGWMFVSGLAWAPDGMALYVSGFGTESHDDAAVRVSLDGVAQIVLRGLRRLRLLDTAANGRMLVDRSIQGSRLTLHPRDPGESSRDLTWLSDSVLDALSADGELALFTVRVRSFELGAPLYPIYIRPTSGGAPTLLGTGYGLAISPDKRWALTRTRPATGEPVPDPLPARDGDVANARPCRPRHWWRQLDGRIRGPPARPPPRAFG